MTKHLIIGNGIAGISAAEAIRALDPEASITFIAREEVLPYSRPMISSVLAGSADFSQLPIRNSGFYQDLGAEVVTGQEAVRLDLDKRTVTTSDGAQKGFETLLIASGADPRNLKVPGAGAKGVFYMRSAGDVHGILRALPGTTHALVLGGGLVGFKAAYGLLNRGVPVTMLITSGYPLSMQVDAEAGAMIQAEMVKHGLKVEVGVEVTALEADGTGRVSRAQLSNGGSLDCQLVVVGKGVWPSLGFIDPEQITVDAGVVVDDHMMTSRPGIYAAGDVAEHFDLARGTRRVNAIWPVAVEMGRIAGMNMAGRKVAYRGSLSRNVIRIFGLDVLTAGLVNPPEGEGCQVMARLNERLGTYRKLVFKNDRLIGATMVGEVEQGGVLMNAVSSRLLISGDKQRLLEPGFNYAYLLPRAALAA